MMFFPAVFFFLVTARYRLKYCLKGPFNPKQPTNQPNRMNGTLVHSSVNIYPYIAYLHTLLHESAEAKKSKLTEQLYYPDSVPFFDETNPNTGNFGLFTRYTPIVEVVKVNRNGWDLTRGLPDARQISDNRCESRHNTETNVSQILSHERRRLGSGSR